MRTLPVSNEFVRFNNAFKADEGVQKTSVTEVIEVNKKEQKNGKTGQIVTSALALAALVGSGIAIVKNRSNAGKDEAVNELKNQLNQAIKSLEERLAKAEESADKEKLTEELNSLKDLVSEKVKWFDGFNDGTVEKLSEIRGKLDALGNSMINAGIGERGMIHIDGLQLMQNMMTNEAIPASQDMITYLKTVASKYIKGKVPLKKLTKDSITWSISTETKARGTGGQGEIFSQQAKNFREVGIKSYSILGGNEIAGAGGIHSIDGNHFCWYKGNEIKIDKFVEYNIDTYRGGKHSLEKVTVYTGISPTSGEQILIFDNPKYFSSNQTIYGNSSGGVTERERATMLGKAAYTLEKLIRDRKSVPNYNIVNSKIFNEIKAPDAVYLHDTAAAPYAAIARMLAPMEAANGELSKEAAKAISEKNIVAKSHNFDYRGEARDAEKSDILNTAFDKYAADIYRYAETGFAEEGLYDIGKVATSGDSVSFANWMLCFANDIENVSHTDLLERVEGKVNQGQRSGSSQHILAERFKYKTIHGHGNSWDRSINEVSVEKLPMYNDMINQDLVAIMQAEVKKIKSSLTESEQKLLSFNDVNIKNFNDVVEILRKMNNPEVNKTLAKLDAEGITKLRSIVPYTQMDSKEHMLNAKKQNKMRFIEHIRTVEKYNKEHPDAQILDFHIPDNIDLSNITMENIDDVVICNMGVRLVEQKNIPMALRAAELVAENFEQKFPGKKFILLIGGPDETANKVFHNMIKESAKETKGVIAKTGRTPNPVWNACSDFTWRTSVFEPDGDTAESLYRGTAPILTRVGGYVDRLDGTGKGFLAKRTPAQIIRAGEDLNEGMAQDYKDAVFEAFDVFFNNHAEYENIIKRGIDSEYSWIVKNAEGKITRDCGVARDLEMLGYDLNTFPEFAKV